MTTATAIRRQMRILGDTKVASHSQRFFRTGPGEYGEGDKFLGIRVPIVRKLVREHRGAPIKSVLTLLRSPWHEERQFAVLSLAARYKDGDELEQCEIFDAYIANLKYVNNWDLVDGSAHLIVGPWLESRSRKLLYKLAGSKNLWERRVSIMSTYHFIRNKDFAETLTLAEMLLHDDHDLIHKAVGWMLREVGNRDRPTEEKYLKKHYKEMPRTMLRYAIEKFPENKRQAFLKGRA